jgi:hypothetical protein
MFTAVLILILGYLVLFHPPVIVNNYIIYVRWGDGYRLSTHIYMLPAVYTSILFLATSIGYLRRNVGETLNHVQGFLSLSRTPSKDFVEEESKLVLSPKANVFASIAVACLFLTELAPHYLSGAVPLYVNGPMLAYFLTVYSTIVFLVAHFIWLFFTSAYTIYRFSRMSFSKDLDKLGNWIRSDRLGGIRPLSNLSLRLLIVYVIGVLIFSPSPMVYLFYLYALDLFGIFALGTSTFFVLQFLLHSTIRREKKQLLDLAEQRLQNRTRIEYIFKIEQIQEWPIDIRVVLGLLFSSMVWPLVVWYLSKLLETFFGVRF